MKLWIGKKRSHKLGIVKLWDARFEGVNLQDQRVRGVKVEEEIIQNLKMFDSKV